MRSLVILVCMAIPWACAQHVRGPRQSHGHGWDIRLAVPGEPGTDYPTLGTIPRTSFSCAGKEPGYYADLETNCQVFRVCTSGSTYGFQSFLCPNGTLFNQGVFVCDWWMNVHCESSELSFSNNRDQFGNLKLGPQLMKDIKKMLTHPMRYPYNRSTMKSNLIVMQDYKPPQGQMFPNEAFLASPRTPNSLYESAKQIQQEFNGYNGNVFAASTPNPSYIPPDFNNLSPSQRDAEVFQRLRQNSQFQQSGRLQSTQPTSNIPNGHTGQITQNYNQAQYQTNFANVQPFGAGNQKVISQQNTQYTDNRGTQFSGQQSEFGISFTKQKYTNNGQRQRQNESPGSTEAKQNLVSDEVPSTIVTKSLTFNRIVDPKPGSPKSRITFKTWIVKPSKAAKLIAEPTSYSYVRPTNPPAEKIRETTPYFYNPPTALTQAEKLVSEAGTGPYVYSRPTVAAKQISKEPSRFYLTPTTPRPTLSGRLYLPPSSAPPTISARLLAPTTYRPASKLYVPPSQANLIISRQYLSPNALQQPTYYQSEQLRASPTSPTPVYAAPNADNNNPSFTLTKHSRINANRNNLTFTDILTKEKLDITVNDIVSDTSKILNTASPQSFSQYRQDYTDDSHPQSETNSESDEQLTPQSPTDLYPSSQLIVDPSRDLQPPIETITNSNQNTNRLSNLPFYKEPSTNTIERTVSLKISIPEKVASYLLNSNNETDYNKLEILNTGSSNYLVLTNNLLTKNPGASFIPIGRLISDKKSNISDSQALVFSLLADSINVAKEYRNIAQQQVISPTAQTKIQNTNNEDLSRITNQISQLTATQFSGSNNFNHANVVATTAQTTPSNVNQYNAKYTNNLIQNRPQQRPQLNSVFSENQRQFYSNKFNGDLQSNQIYSGQLYQVPVPDVTSQIYNAGAANIIQADRSNPQSPNHFNANQNIGADSNKEKQSSAEVEKFSSQTLPGSPAKLRFAPTTSNDAETFNSREHSTQTILNNLLNSGNGIAAQLQDKIVGTISHPQEENKLVTYKKDQSYYVFTNLNNNPSTANNPNNNNNVISQQNAKLIQNTNVPNIVRFQFIPSVGYQLEDEREQQKILNAFQIDEFGSPKNDDEQIHQQDIPASEVNYSIEHPKASKLIDGQFDDVNSLYVGPSSYSAPQSSVGSLETRGQIQQNNLNSRLEQLDDNTNGYGRIKPAKQYSY